jgi:predicted DNA binding CopG/RHH family protein
MTKRIESTDEAWEDGTLGRSQEHARRVARPHDEQLDEGLGLQMISIRLPKTLIEELKAIGQSQGLGYQPLVRQVLTRFAHSELKRIAMEQLSTPPNGSKRVA